MVRVKFRMLLFFSKYAQSFRPHTLMLIFPTFQLLISDAFIYVASVRTTGFIARQDTEVVCVMDLVTGDVVCHMVSL